MIGFRELYTGLKQLGIKPGSPVLAHSSLSAFGEVRGGADTLLGSMLAALDVVMMPTFTYRVMVTPETGPERNGITYGSGGDANRMAEIYSPEMPADPMMGVVSEKLRRHPDALRSSHPILSFAGINVASALGAQTLTEPLAPIQQLAEHNGWVVLLGVDHRVNTSFHFAEKLAGRKQFVRWALTNNSVVECPGFPGCSTGFEAAAPYLEGITQRVTIGDAMVRALPLEPMIDIVVNIIRADSLALLCDRPDCERCNTQREIYEMS